VSDEETLVPKVTLADKLGALEKPWVPTIVAELNEQYVKVVRFEGEYVWHQHEHQDEMFLVVNGSVRICFRGSEVTLGPGELLVVPRGVEHKPVADGPAEVLLFEPVATRNTGDVDHALTIEADELPRG
jgi:mannose-6-phosphate isomerase-like protein (cupin superfamily)